jgi:hypothetical protein
VERKRDRDDFAAGSTPYGLGLSESELKPNFKVPSHSVVIVASQQIFSRPQEERVASSSAGTDYEKGEGFWVSVHKCSAMKKDVEGT